MPIDFKSIIGSLTSKVSALPPVKSAIDRATASLEAQVGRFLLLKETILSLPSGPVQTSLLKNHDALESTSLSLLSRASSLKTRLTNTTPNLLDTSLLSQANTLLRDSAAFAGGLKKHKAEVDAASGKAVKDEGGVMNPQLAAALKMAAALGATAFAVNWVRREARRRTA